jgi:uncharacterized membrane protein
MPGVSVTTVDAPLPPSARVPDSGQYFAAILADRGSTVAPTICRSMAEFEAAFGKRQSYSFAYDDVQTFFAEGGGRYVGIRVVGPAAVTASVTIVALKFDAKSPGAWGNNLTVTIVAGSLPGTYALIISESGAQVEKWDNLVTVDDAIAQLAASTFVNVSKVSAVVPVPTAATALTLGNDDRAAVTNAHYTAALTLFPKSMGPGAVAIPGQPSTAIGTALIDHAFNNNRVAINHTPIATSRTTAESNATALTAVKGKSSGLYWPWVKIRDAAGERAIPPTGYVAAARARVIAAYGAPGAAYAGEISTARTLSGVETVLPVLADYDTATAKGVSCIRVVQNSIRIYGCQSLSSDPVAFRWLYPQDLVNHIASLCETVLEPYVFRPIDGKGRLYAEIEQMLTAQLIPFARNGLLFAKLDANGKTVDQGFTIEVAAVNTPSNVANGVLKARVGVRPSPTAELIAVEIIKLPVQN